MEATTWQTDQVADRHRDPTVTVRPTDEVKSAAVDVLAAQGWTLQAYLLACLAELLANPARRLSEIEHYRPEPKPIGRPPKARDESAGNLVGEPFEDPA